MEDEVNGGFSEFWSVLEESMRRRLCAGAAVGEGGKKVGMVFLVV